MAKFLMQIAGHTAKIHSLFESTPLYCQKYHSQELPAFTVAVTREDLEFEAAALYEEALQEGFRVRNFPDPFLERTAIQRKFAEYLFDHDILLLHGSTVAVDGNAYLFTAKCGTGKSTHTRLWCQYFGDRAVMVNDDKPFIQITKDGIFACGGCIAPRFSMEWKAWLGCQYHCSSKRNLPSGTGQRKPHQTSGTRRFTAHASYPELPSLGSR